MDGELRVGVTASKPGMAPGLSKKRAQQLRFACGVVGYWSCILRTRQRTVEFYTKRRFLHVWIRGAFESRALCLRV